MAAGEVDAIVQFAVIGGDGTGPEVVAEGLKVLKAVAAKENFQYQTRDYDFSGKAYMARGGDPTHAGPPLGPPRVGSGRGSVWEMGAAGPSTSPSRAERDVRERSA